MRRVRVVDSHTEGEPTRVVIDGAPDLGGGTANERLAIFRAKHDAFRRGVVLEPRGHDALVGALLYPPRDPAAAAQVLFFNNSGVLGMCGHGAIGVAVTLHHLGRVDPGTHRLETPVGDVAFTLEPGGAVSVENARAYRWSRGVEVATAHYGTVRGDVAWGGNWFFLIREHDQEIATERIPELTAFAIDVRHALERDGVTGEGGGVIDHVELFGPPGRPDADSKNFVLCPGLEYDRSPCGTGTSAKLACLAADGELAEGAVWRQESTIGSLFEASYRRVHDGVIPTIRGRAWVTAESTLLFHDDDPFRAGIG